MGTNQPAYSSTCLGQRHLTQLFIISIHTRNNLDCNPKEGESCGDNATYIGLLRLENSQFSPSAWALPGCGAALEH